MQPKICHMIFFLEMSSSPTVRELRRKLSSMSLEYQYFRLSFFSLGGLLREISTQAFLSTDMEVLSGANYLNVVVSLKRYINLCKGLYLSLVYSATALVEKNCKGFPVCFMPVSAYQ